MKSIILSLLMAVTGTGTAIADVPDDPLICTGTEKEVIECLLVDYPPLLAIAQCESGLRHIDQTTGKVLRGLIDPDDTGVLQINKRYHLAQAEQMGLDIEKLEDNVKYGIWLYEKEGKKPWQASGTCQTKLGGGTR